MPIQNVSFKPIRHYMQSVHLGWIDNDFVIDVEQIKNQELLQKRIDGVEKKFKNELCKILRYLYSDNAKGTLSKGVHFKHVSSHHLSKAEKKILSWFYTRTNGRLKKSYGPNSIICVKHANFRCCWCQNPDVRVLQIDHVTGRKDESGSPKRIFFPWDFQCLCANCHTIKTVESNQEN